MAILRYRRESGADDVSLIRSVARRDRAAFEVLYRRYYPRLYRYLFRITRREELVEEILNDVMFAVWKGANQFRERSKVSTWIFGIGYRQAMKTIGRANRGPATVGDEALESATAEGNRPLSRSVLRLTFVKALQVLSPEQRAVVELTYYHGYSYPEIARIVDCPVNTVKTRMFHARRRLARFLQADEGTAGATLEA